MIRGMISSGSVAPAISWPMPCSTCRRTAASLPSVISRMVPWSRVFWSCCSGWTMVCTQRVSPLPEEMRRSISHSRPVWAAQGLLQGRAVLFMHPGEELTVVGGCRRRLQAEDPVSFLGPRHGPGDRVQRPVAQLGYTLRLRQARFAFAQVLGDHVGYLNRTAVRGRHRTE